MDKKKIATRSLSALAFCFGAGHVAQANNDVNIQNLELTEETKVSPEDLEMMAAATLSGKTGIESSFVHSGNYASFVHSANYASFIHNGNYANFIHAGNYANFIHAGNYGRVDGEMGGDVPQPVIATTNADDSTAK